MRVDFAPDRLKDPHLAVAAKAVRDCVHCGMCTAICPTFSLLGDELDSPRGRIYIMKDMLEKDRPPTAAEVTHIDRCLMCLACTSVCPAHVDYMHLVDHARAHIAKTHRRPVGERMVRSLLSWVLPNPTAFRLALLAGRLGRPFRALVPGRLRGMLDMVPAQIHGPHPSEMPGSHPALGKRRLRVALMTGCAQKALAPDINAATIRLLTRLGCDVVVAEGAGCCGALDHHMGDEATARRRAAANVDAWAKLDGIALLDAIVINTSGCGTQVKDYGFLLQENTQRAETAAGLSARVRDITELVAELGLGRVRDVGQTGLTVTYHPACSLQHGQKITAAPKSLLSDAGFTVSLPAEAEMCCGSAGTYNLLQPEIAGQLGDRKAARIAATEPDLIAAGNIGCMTQIAARTQVPVVHTVQLLDWATGGPDPR